jgi:hypothetical protein
VLFIYTHTGRWGIFWLSSYYLPFIPPSSPRGNDDCASQATHRGKDKEVETDTSNEGAIALQTEISNDVSIPRFFVRNEEVPGVIIQITMTVFIIKKTFSGEQGMPHPLKLLSSPFSPDPSPFARARNAPMEVKTQ